MDIQGCRNEIDRIDGELQQLFEKRMQMAAEISRLKSQRAISTVNAEREREILLRVDGNATPDLRLTAGCSSLRSSTSAGRTRTVCATPTERSAT